MSTRTPVSFTIETKEVPAAIVNSPYTHVDVELVMQAGGTRTVLWSDCTSELNEPSNPQFDAESQVTTRTIEMLESIPDSVGARLDVDELRALEQRVAVLEALVDRLETLVDRLERQ